MRKNTKTDAGGNGVPFLKSELSRMENLYRAVVEDQSELICRFLPDGTLTFVNSAYCEFFGKTSDELLGKSYEPIVHEDDLGEARSQAGAMTPDNPVRTTENRVYRRDGAARWTQWVSHAFFDENGEKIEEQAVGRDVTEKKEAERESEKQQEQLMRADKLLSLGNLVSGVAHEINNPNNFILLNAEALREAWEDCLPILDSHFEERGDFRLGKLNYSRWRDSAGELFDGIIDGGERIRDLIDELRNFSKQDDSEDGELIDLREVVKAAETILGNKIKKTTSRFAVTAADDLPLVRGGFQKLQQVVINLIQNACAALESRDQGIKIVLSRDAAEGEVVVHVIDEGVGVSETELDRVGDPFYTTRRGIGGLGLGLPICQHIIHLLHGSIHYESSPGEGMKVEVRLPEAEV